MELILRSSWRHTLDTWSVITLHACDKVTELTHLLKRHHWDTLGIAEVRLLGFRVHQQTKVWFNEEAS
ncbi:hypothetical protein DPMN_007896 [Dreissena polymorpha]|uniref:Uncharacterized protein n=1 Tax=Dreissena polymorpha TaxID=45954 RepID=A0A9D4MU45_DREPO|nr:hypothetical protein DPMN_007896 [Dreissena polymorpha]